MKHMASSSSKLHGENHGHLHTCPLGRMKYLRNYTENRVDLTCITGLVLEQLSKISTPEVK